MMGGTWSCYYGRKDGNSGVVLELGQIWKEGIVPASNWWKISGHWDGWQRLVRPWWFPGGTGCCMFAYVSRPLYNVPYHICTCSYISWEMRKLFIWNAMCHFSENIIFKDTCRKHTGEYDRSSIAGKHVSISSARLPKLLHVCRRLNARMKCTSIAGQCFCKGWEEH